VNERWATFHFTDEKAQRLDKFLVVCLPEFSRTRLQNLIDEELVQVNGAPAEKAGQMLDAGAVVEVHIPSTQPTDLIPEAIPLEIVFENTDLMVVNKPAGMVAHPSPGHYSGTLVHAALAHAPEMEGVGGELRPGVVHRLDRDTSGLILLAKNDAAHQKLQNQFRDRQVRKVYLALVDGHPPTPTGRIEAPIGRNTSHRQLMTIVVAAKGREAVTEYRTLETFPQHTLLEAHPLTGRTHQIRVHLKFIGCPVAGDTVYGKKHSTLPIGRHFLHAARLTITLPGETAPRTFEAPLPADLQAVLEMLRSRHT
jgi:23S rRNA pseudouridine1911/1915/1917 synthase